MTQENQQAFVNRSRLEETPDGQAHFQMDYQLTELLRSARNNSLEGQNYLAQLETALIVTSRDLAIANAALVEMGKRAQGLEEQSRMLLEELEVYRAKEREEAEAKKQDQQHEVVIEE